MNKNPGLQAQRKEWTSFVVERSDGRRVLLGLFIVCGLVLACLIVWNIRLLSRQIEQMAQNDREHLFWAVCHPGPSTAERTRAFQTLVATGNTEWRGALLEQLDLEGADLRGAELQYANLRGARLAKAALAGADLSHSVLLSADLAEADLYRTKLVEADLLKANVTKARLREANLSGATLEQAVAQDADFVKAELSEANLLMGDFTDANFTLANLSGANLEGTILRGANLGLTNLKEAKLRDTDFTDSNWWRTIGLTPAQLGELNVKFPPSENALETRKSDYQFWLNRTGTDSAPR